MQKTTHSTTAMKGIRSIIDRGTKAFKDVFSFRKYLLTFFVMLFIFPRSGLAGNCDTLNNVAKQMGVSNPTCRQVYDYNSYLNVVSPSIQAHYNLVYAKVNLTIKANEYVGYIVDIGDAVHSLYSFAKTPISDSIATGIYELPKAILDTVADKNDNTQLFVKTSADILINAITITISTGAKSVSSAVVLVPDALSVLNDFLAAFTINQLNEQLNDMLAAWLYLGDYYKYGGNNGAVAVLYGKSYNSSVSDTIEAIAVKALGLKNTSWDTKYDVNKIKRIIEGFKDVVAAATSISMSEQQDNAPYFSSIALSSSVTRPNKLYFSGYAKDDKSLSKITLKVNGPRGNDITAWSYSVNSNNLSLKQFFFDSNSNSYAGKAGNYSVSLWIKDSSGQTCSKTFIVKVK